MSKPKWLWLAFGFVSIIWLFNGLVYPWIVPSLGDRALNGDAFGAANALFSGLAFAGLIYTILMQREELALQRNELRLQREEMAESRGELKNQALMQKGQVKAMICQMKISGLEAEIQALKEELRVLDVTKARGTKIEEIRKKSKEMKTLASSLNTEFFLFEPNASPIENALFNFR